MNPKPAGERRSEWIGRGVLNTLEHAITRVSDAATSLVLLWALAPEVFSKLVLAQAVVAPLLFLFVSPEAVLYRDFAKWKAEGISRLALRVHALRKFGWGKAQVAVILALGIGYFYPGAGGFAERFYALIWAFSLALAPQISGADREFLRIELRLKALNFISLFQKVTLLVGTVIVALAGCRTSWLAAVAAFSALSTAISARFFAARALRMLGASSESLRGEGDLSVVAVVRESLQGFSMWSHFCGVCTNWVQTMDLFFLGLFSFPARVTGLYAAALKISNFANAMPMALSNLFSVWIGRRHQTQTGQADERKRLLRLSLMLFGTVFVQAVMLAWIAPWLIETLSHGRWTGVERSAMASWLDWILAGNVIVSSTYLLSSWLMVRSDVRKYFAYVVLSWTCFSIAIYAGAALLYGPDWVARANLAVGVLYLLLNLFFGRVS